MSETATAQTYKIFAFNPQDYAEQYREHGYVHIKQGLSKEFFEWAKNWTREQVEGARNEVQDWKFKGKKMQFLIDFPEVCDYPQGLYDGVGGVADLPADRMMVGERHLKVYENVAAARPPAHKDRLASEVTVGFGIDIPEDSRVMIWPHDHLTINPYNSSKMWRDSRDEHDLPENTLKDIEPVYVDMRPGDVVMFAGASLYHERSNPANTSVMYLKFNASRLDPINEDPQTMPQREKSLQLLGAAEGNDTALLDGRLEVSPLLHDITRIYTRLHWKEVLHANVHKQNPFVIDDEDLRIFKAIRDDMPRTRDVLARLGEPLAHATPFLTRLRRLIKLGGVDLL